MGILRKYLQFRYPKIDLATKTCFCQINEMYFLERQKHVVPKIYFWEVVGTTKKYVFVNVLSVLILRGFLCFSALL